MSTGQPKSANGSREDRDATSSLIFGSTSSISAKYCPWSFLVLAYFRQYSAGSVLAGRALALFRALISDRSDYQRQMDIGREIFWSDRMPANAAEQNALDLYEDFIRY